MLAYILAVLVGTGSVGLYISAFFFPEIHRKQDFIWSGVGFFYALTLWIYARQETGGILVGQISSVLLLGWFAWQTLKLRRQLVPVNQQTPIPNPTKLKEQLGSKQSPPKTAKPPKPPAPIKPIAVPVETPITRHSQQQEAASVKNSEPEPVRQIVGGVSPLENLPASPAPVVEEEAWIKLEVKPASVKPLGTAVQPPTAIKPEPASAPVIIPAVTTQDPPTNQTSTKVEIEVDLESQNWQ
jgi:Ycf66 protein N-terminus